MPIARISVTVPRDVLAAADRRARELDRSRSWLVAEALRRYLASPAATVVREPAAPPYGRTVGLGSSRLAQLQADLGLTPEQRVREAERTARVAEPAARGRGNRVVTFDRYEDYLEWKRFGDLAP